MGNPYSGSERCRWFFWGYAGISDGHDDPGLDMFHLEQPPFSLSPARSPRSGLVLVLFRASHFVREQRVHIAHQRSRSSVLLNPNVLAASSSASINVSGNELVPLDLAAASASYSAFSPCLRF